MLGVRGANPYKKSLNLPSRLISAPSVGCRGEAYPSAPYLWRAGTGVRGWCSCSDPRSGRRSRRPVRPESKRGHQDAAGVAADDSQET